MCGGLKNELNMGKKMQAIRLGDVAACRIYFSELLEKFEKYGSITGAEVNGVCEILIQLRKVRKGKKSRLGKRERAMVKAAYILMDKVVARKKAGDMSEEDVQMLSYATGTWKVIAEEMHPVNKQAHHLQDVECVPDVDREGTEIAELASGLRVVTEAARRRGHLDTPDEIKSTPALDPARSQMALAPCRDVDVVVEEQGDAAVVLIE